MWSNVFVPNSKKVRLKPKNTPQEVFDRFTYREQSVQVLEYLFSLGEALSKDSFFVHCDAQYSLVEGGFLTEDMSVLMGSYLKDTPDGREANDDYDQLSKKQKELLDDLNSGKRTNSLEDRILYTQLANPPVQAYREAILEGRASKRFIELVNELISGDDTGMWDTVQTREFLNIWYEHNKANFGGIFDTPEGLLHEDPQKKLARIIFQNVDIRLRLSSTDKLTQFLDKYIKDFKLNKLDRMCKTGLTKNFFSSRNDVPLHTKFYGFEKQKSICLEHIKAMHDDYARSDLEITSPFVEPEYIGDIKIGEIKIAPAPDHRQGSQFLFVHSILALECENIISVNEMTYGTTEMFDIYDRGFQFKIIYDPNSSKEITPTTSNDTNRSSLHHTIYYMRDSGIFTINDKEVAITKDTTIDLVLQSFLPLGEEKSVRVAYKETTTNRSKNSKTMNRSDVSDDEMYDALKNRIKDLMKFLKKQGVKTKLSLSRNHDSGTVSLYEKKR